MTAPTVFLSRLNQADQAALAARWAVQHYQREEVILAHDDFGRDVFFVLEGRARATIFSEGGRAVAYRDIGAGDIFGELAAIDGKARSTNVVALEPVRAAKLPEAVFHDIVNTHPGFTWALLEHLSGQMRRMTDRVYEFSTLVVRKRLIRELLRLAEGANSGEGEVSIKPAPTHFDLAARISTHREAVSRAMSELARRKLIEKRRGALVLRDLETLKTLGSYEDEV
jgi:CRP/FNR family transcriptional regulator, cyclic AMP receptor protein